MTPREVLEMISGLERWLYGPHWETPKELAEALVVSGWVTNHPEG